MSRQYGVISKTIGASYVYALLCLQAVKCPMSKTHATSIAGGNEIGMQYDPIAHAETWVVVTFQTWCRVWVAQNGATMQ